MKNRAGYFKSNLSGEMEYKSFVPAVLPPNPTIELNKDIVDILVKANKEIALLEGIATRIPNMDLFISMYVRKEALMSSQIEGTQATLEDVLDPNLEENTNRPVGDVVNYIKATDFAINKLSKRTKFYYQVLEVKTKVPVNLDILKIGLVRQVVISKTLDLYHQMSLT